MKILCLILLTIGFTGCSHKYFYPITPNVPMHSNSGEFTASGGYTFNDEYDGVEGQLAYSLTNHVGLTGNFIYVKGVQNEINDYGTGKMGELGIGYFSTINKFHFAVYAGGGLGDQLHKYPTDTVNFSTSEMNMNRIYIQPSVGFKSKYFETAFSTRFSRLDFSNVTSNIDAVSDPYNYDIVTLIDEDRPFYLFEPSIMLRAGSERIKFQTNLGLLYDFKDKGVFVRSAISLGIHVRLGKTGQEI